MEIRDDNKLNHPSSSFHPKRDDAEETGMKIVCVRVCLCMKQMNERDFVFRWCRCYLPLTQNENVRNADKMEWILKLEIEAVKMYWW